MSCILIMGDTPKRTPLSLIHSTFVRTMRMINLRLKFYLLKMAGFRHQILSISVGAVISVAQMGHWLSVFSFT